MNRLDTSQATITNGQPLIPLSVKWVEDGIVEALANLALASYGPYIANDVVVLIDPGIVVVSNTATWNQGAFLYNGEIYTLLAGTAPKTGPQTFVFTNTVTNGSPDPIHFEDDTQKNVHNVRQFQIIGGTSGGSGVTNYVSDYNGATVKPFKGQWITVGALGAPAFQNSWTNFGVPYQVLQFKKSGNRIYIRGLIIGGASNAVIFNLPNGYRPLSDRVFCSVAPDNTTLYTGWGQILISGDVKVYGFPDTTNGANVEFVFDID